MVQVGANRYGKAEIRVVRVARGAGHDGSDVIRDWNVSTALSGDLDGTHLTGDNSHVLPTDSQKNRVYALAKELGAVEPETFALKLASFFVSSQEPITRARIYVEEYGWTPIGATGYSFARAGDLVRTTTVVHDAAAGTLGGVGDQGPDRHEHHRVGVLGVPEGRAHDAGRDQGPDPGDGGERLLAVPARGRGRRRLGGGGLDREADDPRHVRGHLLVLAAADALRARLRAS